MLVSETDQGTEDLKGLIFIPSGARGNKGGPCDFTLPNFIEEHKAYLDQSVDKRKA